MDTGSGAGPAVVAVKIRERSDRRGYAIGGWPPWHQQRITRTDSGLCFRHKRDLAVIASQT